MEDCLAVHVIEPGEEFIVDDTTYTALEVTHSPGSFGLLAKTKRGRAAYIPDTGPLPPATLEAIRGVETLILGASFWGRNRLPEDHLSVEEALSIARDIRPKEFYLTHLSMHYDSPVTNRELESYLAPFGESYPCRPRRALHTHLTGGKREQQRGLETRSFRSKEILLLLLPSELRGPGLRKGWQGARDRGRPGASGKPWGIVRQGQHRPSTPQPSGEDQRAARRGLARGAPADGSASRGTRPWTRLLRG